MRLKYIFGLHCLTGMTLFIGCCFLSGCSKSDSDRKIEVLTSKIKRHPDDANAYNQRGVYFELLNETEKAIDDYTQAITLAPKTANYHFNRGNAYHSLGKYEQALDDYNQAIEFLDDDPQFYYNRGLVEKELGHIDKAIKNCNAAIWLNKNDPAYTQQRGELYQLQKKQELANDDFAKAKELQKKLLNDSPSP